MGFFKVALPPFHLFWLGFRRGGASGSFYGRRGKQFVNFHPKTFGYLLECEQLGVLFYTQLIKLIKFVADATRLGRPFLCPPKRFPKFSYSSPERI